MKERSSGVLACSSSKTPTHFSRYIHSLYRYTMASLLLILSTVYYLANTITALPRRNVDYDYEVFGFIGEKHVDETKAQAQR